MTIRYVASFGVMLVLSACSGGGEAGGAGQESAAASGPASLYETEIGPLLQANCATCHLTGAEAGEMSLVPAKAIASLVNVDAVGAKGLKRVVPGDPDKSYLVMKLEGTQGEHGGIGTQMPFGAAPLAPAQIARVRQWIKDGAKP